MRSLYKIWNGRKIITRNTKLVMYRAFITPILTYNMAASGASDTKMEKLETTQRRHLRRILGIYYPNRIQNSRLYDICECNMLKQSITQSRWKLFGHILRQPMSTPAFKAMEAYFTSTANKHRGRPPTSLKQILDQEASLANRKLRDIQDLQDFRRIAANRRAWKRLTSIIVTRRTRLFRQDLERANMEASARAGMESNLTITIPRSLWPLPQGRLDGQDSSIRRRRLRLILPSSAEVGDTEPNVSSKGYTNACLLLTVIFHYILVAVGFCFFTILLMYIVKAIQ